MSKPKYLELLEESIEGTKKFLDSQELSHYMIGDTPEVDGNKAFRDKLEHKQVYYLSTYSTLLEMKEMFDEFEKTGVMKPYFLSNKNEDDVIDLGTLLGMDKGEQALIEALKLVSGNVKTRRSGGATIISGEVSSKEDLKKVLEDALKKLEEEDK